MLGITASVAQDDKTSSANRSRNTHLIFIHSVFMATPKRRDEKRARISIGLVWALLALAFAHTIRQ